MVVDSEHFLLVAGEFGRGSFEGDQDGMCVAAKAYYGGALFDRFEGVFDLMEAALWGEDSVVTVVGVAEHCAATFEGGRVWRLFWLGGCGV